MPAEHRRSDSEEAPRPRCVSSWRCWSLLPGQASAKEYDLPAADVEIVVLDDGSLAVTEQITFAFDGSFSGAYRDVAVRSGERVTDIAVSEGDPGLHRPGAPTALGSDGDPGTFGVEDLGNRIRIVWHYRATDEARTFTITYRMTGLAVAYDDVVDVYLKVWGDEWAVGLDHLESRMILPDWRSPGRRPGVGPPRHRRRRDRARRRRCVAFTGGRWHPEPPMGRVPGGVPFRVAHLHRRRHRAVGQRPGRYPGRGGGDRRAHRRHPQGHRNSLLVVAGAAALLPLYLAGCLPTPRQRTQGRLRPRVRAVAADCAAPGPGRITAPPGEGRRGRLRRHDVRPHPEGCPHRRTHHGRTQDLGRTAPEQISDLEIGLGPDPGTLRDFERSTLTVMNRVLEDGPRPLNEFRKAIREDAAANAKTYDVFEAQDPQGTGSRATARTRTASRPPTG